MKIFDDVELAKQFVRSLSVLSVLPQSQLQDSRKNKAKETALGCARRDIRQELHNGATCGVYTAHIFYNGGFGAIAVFHIFRTWDNF